MQPLKKRTEQLEVEILYSGLGDTIFAHSIIKKIFLMSEYCIDVFSHHPHLFSASPYIENSYNISEKKSKKTYEKKIRLFDSKNIAHWHTDTFDYLSIPINLPQLTFMEKQILFFPNEQDRAETFDIILNTSQTWGTRSWPIENWQRLADELKSRNLSVAVVGKDVHSEADGIIKKSPELAGCTNLSNKTSLDQTYYTIKKSKLFVSCQNGLSVLSGATDTQLIILGMSIDWSKRAIYRNEDPHHKIRYINGACRRDCGAAYTCPLTTSSASFDCIPDYSAVRSAVLDALNLSA